MQFESMNRMHNNCTGTTKINSQTKTLSRKERMIFKTLYEYYDGWQDDELNPNKVATQLGLHYLLTRDM